MRAGLLRALGMAAVVTLVGASFAAPVQAAGSGLDGTITNQLTGAPVSGAGVVIKHPDGTGWNFTNSDAQGRFAFPDATGDYRVQVSANDYVEQWLHGRQYEWEADLVTAPTTIRVPLMPIQYGTVAGRVVSQQGKGVADVNVELRRDGNWVENTGTDAKGRFSFSRVETGPGYTAVFKFPAGQEIWYDGAGSEDQATRFTVTPDATTTVNLTRPPVGTLAIRALDAVTKEPIVNYCFYHQDGPVPWHTTCTDSTGRAVLRDLTVGEYSGGGYDPNEIYVNGHFDPVAVTEGTTTTVRVKLEKSVKLRVNFVDAASGDPVDGACVTLADEVRNDVGDGNDCGDQVEFNNLFAQEHFRLFVVPYDGQHGAQWVSTTGAGTGDPAQARIFRPAPGDRLTVTVQLDGAGSVSGVVTDAATGAGVSAVCPSPTGPAGSWGRNALAECTENDGRYTVRNLGPYEWKLAFPAFDGQHAWAWSGGAANRTAATPVRVTAGEVADLDIALPATGTISGTVNGPSGQPPAQWVTLVARDAVTGDYAGITTSPRPDGTFLMRGFNTQDVRLYYSGHEDLLEYPTVLRTTAGSAITDVAITVPVR